MRNNPEALNRYQNRNGLRQNGRPEMLRDISARKVDNTLMISGDQVPENTIETLSFGLSLEEKKSIETDINAKNPIGDTPAYRVFLKNIFPNKELTFPYLADYDDALIVVSKLGELCGKTVRLPNKNEAIQSLKDNNHLTGYRDASNGRVEDAGGVGYAWISGEVRGENAPFAWRNRGGGTVSYWNYRRDGHSVIPIFG